MNLCHVLVSAAAAATFLLQPAAAQSQTPQAWNWMKDTYWYVPAGNLLAYRLDANSEQLTPVVDQTVWHITGYHGNYFWGRTVGVITSGRSQSVSCLSVIGSVTPEGRVLLTFVPTSTSPASSVIQGIGDMRLVNGNWAVEPQMSTGPSVQIQISHWAYMMQCQTTDPVCQSLPGVGASIESLLALCPGAPQVRP
jgi:hypothetical protein